MAMIATSQMMLAWLGEDEKAQRLQAAIAATLEEGKVQCKDMGGTASTLEMAKAVAAKV